MPRSLSCRSLMVSTGVLVVLAAASPVLAQGKKYALVVGVRQYTNDELPPLKYPENDAEELGNLLVGGKFTEVVIMTQTRGKDDRDLKPTAANINKQLLALKKKLRRGDLLLVYLSGHGLLIGTSFEKNGRKRDETYFCPEDAAKVTAEDTRIDTLSKTMIPLGKLIENLGDNKQGVKLLLVDACRNEHSARALSNPPRPPHGVAALFSCMATERSYETDSKAILPGGKGHGIFTYHVLESLRKAKNDRGEVTWGLLATQVIRPVTEAASKLGGGATQTPHSVSNLVGEAVILSATDKVTSEDVFRQAIANFTGMGDSVDWTKAYRLFTQAAKDGHVVARATQAFMLHSGMGTDPDPERAATMVRDLLPQLGAMAEKNDDAQVRLGALYQVGIGVKKDEKEAARLYRLAIKRKNAIAMLNLALLHRSGAGVQKDIGKTLDLFKAAADLGHATPMIYLGLLYVEGSDVVRDPQEGFRWFERAAKKGSEIGLFELGKCYERGKGVEKAEKTAIRLFRDAIDRGHPGAMTALGRMCEEGRGMPNSNPKEALRLYEQAAKRNYLPAMFNVGVCYRDGIGTAPDKKRAVEWFHRITEQKSTARDDQRVIELARKQLKELRGDL